MMKKFFALFFCLIMFLCGCAVERVETGISHSSDEVKKKENNVRVLENEIDPLEISPIIYSEKDILVDDSSKTVIKYNSIYALDYISLTIPQNPDAEDSEDGYIGDDVISYGEKEILRTPVYFMGKVPRVFDESLASVQWLDGENAMIDGRFIYNTRNDLKYEFNEDWEIMLNYALNKERDKLAASFMIEGRRFRLSLYDFVTGKWETLFEDENEKVYYHSARLIWRNNDEIIFSAGIKREEAGALSDEEFYDAVLDVYSFNLASRKCTLLMEGADLMCKTGSFANDKIFCAKYIANENGSAQHEIWVYDFAKASASRIYESGYDDIFWLPQKGLFGFYDSEEKCIKLYCDETYSLLGKIDVNSVVSNDNGFSGIVAGTDYIKFSVHGSTNRSFKDYKVNISDIRDRNYYFIDELYLGFTERGEFYNRTHSENVYGEFLTQDGFDVYSQDGYISRSTEVEFDIVPGLDNFFEEKYAELLGKLASEVSEDQQSGVFKLPVSMSEEAFNVPHYDYNGQIDFGVGNVLSNNEYRLVTNAKHNVLPRKVEKVTANENDLEIIRKELERDCITKAQLDESMVEVMLCDLDGDGKGERIIFANSSAEHFVGDEDSGNYAIALIKKKDGIEVLHKQTSRYGETIPDLETWENWMDHFVGSVGCVGIYDLNGDGKFEICIELQQYEHGSFMAFSENGTGKYTLVLNSECGT